MIILRIKNHGPPGSSSAQADELEITKAFGLLQCFDCPELPKGSRFKAVPKRSRGLENYSDQIVS